MERMGTTTRGKTTLYQVRLMFETGDNVYRRSTPKPITSWGMETPCNNTRSHLVKEHNTTDESESVGLTNATGYSKRAIGDRSLPPLISHFQNWIVDNESMSCCNRPRMEERSHRRDWTTMH